MGNTFYSKIFVFIFGIVLICIVSFQGVLYQNLKNCELQTTSPILILSPPGGDGALQPRYCAMPTHVRVTPGMLS